MNIRQMEILLCVSENKSFVKASKQLFITQSAVSQQIQRMEEELGFPLFSREGRAVVLTERGELFIGTIRKMLRMYDRTIRECRETRLDTEKIVLGFAGFANYRSLPAAIRKTQEAYPGGQILSRRIGPVTFHEELNQGIIDLALVPEHFLAGKKGISFFPAISDRHYCVVHKSSPLAGLSRIDYADLEDYTLIAPEKRFCSSQQSAFLEKLKAFAGERDKGQGRAREQVREGSDVDNALIQILSDPGCAAIVPGYTLPVHNEIRSVPLKEDIRITIGFAYVKDLSPMEEELIKNTCRESPDGISCGGPGGAVGPADGF